MNTPPRIGLLSGHSHLPRQLVRDTKELSHGLLSLGIGAVDMPCTLTQWVRIPVSRLAQMGGARDMTALAAGSGQNVDDLRHC